MSSEFTELLGRNSLANIPKDQQKLLDRHGIGSVHPRNYPASADDVPGHVISTAVKAYVERRKRSAAAAQFTSGDRSSKSSKLEQIPSKEGRKRESSLDSKSTVPEPATRKPLPLAPLNSRGNGNGPSTPPRPTNGSNMDSSPEREVSWTPSPHEREARRVTTLGSTGTVPQEVASPVVDKHMAPPPKPREATRMAPNFEFPSSGPEDELEMELPQAEGQGEPLSLPTPSISVPQSSIRTPLVRKHVTMETPPCAQPSQSVIPGTIVDQPNQPIGPAATTIEARTRRMKPIQFSDPPNASPSTQPVNGFTSFQRMPSTKKYVDLSSSNITSSSSRVSATQNANGIGGSNPLPQETFSSSARVTDSPHKAALTQEIPTVEATQEEPDTMESLSGGTPLSSAVVATQPVSILHNYSETAESESVPSTDPETSPEHYQRPFDMFSSVYPSYVERYSGSLVNFVQACICLEHMSKRKTLNHYLWDDFIRTFSSEYLTYARNSQQPMVAAEWYNDRDEEPIYMEKLVQRGTLAPILGHYPSEVARVRRFVTGGDGDSPVSRRSSAASEPRTGRSIPSTPASGVAPTNKFHDADEEEPERRGRRSISSNISPLKQAAPQRFISHPITEGVGDERQMRPTSTNVVKPPTAADPKRHSLGANPSEFPTGTPRHAAAADSSMSASAMAPPSSNRSTTSSRKTALGAYMRSLSKPRSTGEREKWRQQMRKLSGSVSSSSKN